MILQSLNILNYRNIREAELAFADKLNCFVGLNGQGKTNILDAIYLLSFTKSSLVSTDTLNITHGEQMAMVQGCYDNDDTISCGIKCGQKKQFRRGKKDYKRLQEHIGIVPLVMVSPRDEELIQDGSDERRRFMDIVISQYDKQYLDHLTTYNALLKQRNALLKQFAETSPRLNADNEALLDVLDMQMIPLSEYIFSARTAFVQDFVPFFNDIYSRISDNERGELHYLSQLQNRQMQDAMHRTRQRDIILGWTSQGIHKDDILLTCFSTDDTNGYSLKQVGSQGQRKTFLIAMKLSQALFLAQRMGTKPILLLDDIFDKLDSERVARIVNIVCTEQFGQIFLTDTDRQHLTDIIHPQPDTRIFYVENGTISSI